jgi:hypothetical protein
MVIVYEMGSSMGQLRLPLPPCIRQKICQLSVVRRRCIQSDYSGSSSLGLLAIGHALDCPGSCAVTSVNDFRAFISKSSMRARVYWPTLQSTFNPAFYVQVAVIRCVCTLLRLTSSHTANHYKTLRRCPPLLEIGQSNST